MLKHLLPSRPINQFDIRWQRKNCSCWMGMRWSIERIMPLFPGHCTIQKDLIHQPLRVLYVRYGI